MHSITTSAVNNVMCFLLANHSSPYAKDNFQEKNSFYFWKLTFASKNLRKCVAYATSESFLSKVTFTRKLSDVSYRL